MRIRPRWRVADHSEGIPQEFATLGPLVRELAATGTLERAPVVLSRADLVFPGWFQVSGWLTWVIVAFVAIGVVLNTMLGLMKNIIAIMQ